MQSNMQFWAICLSTMSSVMLQHCCWCCRSMKSEATKEQRGHMSLTPSSAKMLSRFLRKHNRSIRLRNISRCCWWCFISTVCFTESVKSRLTGANVSVRHMNHSCYLTLSIIIFQDWHCLPSNCSLNFPQIRRFPFQTQYRMLDCFHWLLPTRNMKYLVFCASVIKLPVQHALFFLHHYFCVRLLCCYVICCQIVDQNFVHWDTFPGELGPKI